MKSELSDLVSESD